MKRLSDAPRIHDLRIVYADLDGTLVGPGGSLFAAKEGGFSTSTVEALRSLHEAGGRLVLMSGRTRRGIGEVARVLGAAAYIAELGALIVERDGGREQVVHNFGAFTGEGSPAEAILRSGAGAYLLERFARRLESVAPWTEATLMFQGWVDPAEADAALAEAGYGWLRFHDNGRMLRRLPHLDVGEVHAMHLLPQGVDKASAVRLHRKRNGIPLESAVAVGDSPSDLLVAREVSAFFLVANGSDSVPADSAPGNAYVTPGAYGEGFAEAIRAALGRWPLA